MAIKVLKILGLLFVVGVVIVLLLPPVTRGRVSARRTQCKNNLKQLLLALRNYESTYHSFPPAHTVGADGNPLHSWRTLILPFLDQQKLYESIDLSKPWNDPANRNAYETVLHIFSCPSTIYPADKTGSPLTETTYLAVVTDNSCLRPSEPRAMSDIEDSHSGTLMLIEVMPELAVHWMSPNDADETMVLNFAANPNLGVNPKRGGTHTGGAHAAMVDGSVRFLSANNTQDKLRALISIAGHEPYIDF